MIKSIPLNKLVQSPRNVRRHSDPTADGELKASIAAFGLLQNLIVKPAAKGKFEVEAGERRRRAMLELADEKILDRDHEVTCLVLEDSTEAAVETSLAENFHRLAMNPADEAQAFAALVSSGATVEDVARRFGLTVRFVEGRLRLATLAPVVFEALASGQITLDIAKAYGALVAVWIVERDDGTYWDADWRTARSPRAQRWLSQIASRFDAVFGDYDCLGHMSNGEGVYAKRAA